MSYNKDTGLFDGYIYLISNDINPKELYVGQTLTTPQVRWSGHLRQVKSHSYSDKLHNKMSYYGVEHFKLEVLEICSCTSKEDLIKKLDDREIHYINLFDSYRHGLNMTRGGRTNSVDHARRSVVQYDLYGDKLAEFDSVDDLKQHLNKECVSSIYSCCYGEIKYAYGFIWRYKGDDLNKYPLPSAREIQESYTRLKSLGKIKQYSTLGDLINTFNTIKEAVQATSIGRHQIMGSCSGKNVTGGGFVWRFEADNFDTFKNTRGKHKVVYQYSKDLQLINIYSSTREASRITGVAYSSIGNVCRGEQLTAGGFIWSYSPLS